MKLNLVVAQGVHEGKVIQITVPEFLIGRDPHCQLLPASPAISKQHCGLFVREGRVFVRDYGSTNGTFVNGEQVAGEREVVHNDHLKAGPLEFRVQIDVTSSPELKPLPENAAPPPPKPAQAKPGAPAKETAAAKPAAQPEPALNATEHDPDQIAAMLLGMDDGDISAEATAEQVIPDGTTVMDIPAAPGGKPDKKDEKKAAPTGDTSSAAAAILSKYMRRPRT